MEDITITLSGTFKAESIKRFAKDKGWIETIISFEESAIKGRIKVETPNPISCEIFVSNYFKDIIIKELALGEIQNIQNQATQDVKEKTDMVQQSINSLVNINIQ